MVEAEQRVERIGQSGSKSRSGGDSKLIHRAPTFVSKSSTAENDLIPSEADDKDKIATGSVAEQELEDSDGSEETDDSASRPASPRVRDEEEDDQDDAPKRAGIGGKGLGAPASAGRAEEPGARPGLGGRGGIGSSSRGRAGIGSAFRTAAGIPPPVTLSESSSGASTPKGGIGSSDAPQQPLAESSTTHTPAAFGRQQTASSSSAAPRQQRSFVTRASTPIVAKPTTLTATEAAHFRKIENDYGAKLLSKLGWAPGKGLGVNEDGRAVPVAAGKVLRGQGITSGVRTEDSKREARRKGEKISDEEDEGDKRKGRRPKPQKEKQDEQSWKKQRKVKVKVEHKTYEQIVAEASDQAASGVGLVLDARSGEVSQAMVTGELIRQLKEVQSLAGLSLSNWTPTGDDMQLPELRHNLRLVMDVSKGDVDALAREGKTVVEKRKWAVREEQLAQKRVDDATNRELCWYIQG